MDLMEASRGVLAVNRIWLVFDIAAHQGFGLAEASDAMAEMLDRTAPSRGPDQQKSLPTIHFSERFEQVVRKETASGLPRYDQLAEHAAFGMAQSAERERLAKKGRSIGTLAREAHQVFEMSYRIIEVSYDIDDGHCLLAIEYEGGIFLIGHKPDGRLVGRTGESHWPKLNPEQSGSCPDSHPSEVADRVTP